MITHTYRNHIFIAYLEDKLYISFIFYNLCACMQPVGRLKQLRTTIHFYFAIILLNIPSSSLELSLDNLFSCNSTIVDKKSSYRNYLSHTLRKWLSGASNFHSLFRRHSEKTMKNFIVDIASIQIYLDHQYPFCLQSIL